LLLRRALMLLEALRPVLLRPVLPLYLVWLLLV
jgi:hypothetical protein